MKLHFSEEIYGIKWGYYDYLEDDFVMVFCILGTNPLSDNQINTTVDEYANLSFSEKTQYTCYLYKSYNLSLNGVDTGEYTDYMWITHKFKE
jgi:hypothetical protein